MRVTARHPTWGGLVWGLSLLLFLTGCTPVRPIAKIGLIAPFEGLYRESGYAALEGMRQAVTDCTPPGLDVLPVALDDSGDPAQAQRAAQKLLVDPAVQAVIGPFLLDVVPAVTTAMQAEVTRDAPLWFVPILIDPAANYGSATSSDWLTAPVDYVAGASAATRILVLGLPSSWTVPMETTIPTQRVDDLDTALATIAAGDATLWLGRPEVGAAWHTAIRQAHPLVEFWLAPQAGHDIFAAHTNDQRATHWLYWARPSYNQWLQPAGSAIEPIHAMRDLAYHATCAALDTIQAGQPVIADWELWERPVRTRHAMIAR